MADLDPWLAELLTSANRNRHCVSDSHSLRRLVKRAKLVVGVWEDVANPNGVDTLVINGKKELRAVLQSRSSKSLRMQGIPCKCYEDALAIEHTFGDAGIRSRGAS